MTNYDYAAHIASVGMNHGVTSIEYLAAKAAIQFDTHMSWEGYTQPTDADRALIRVASERLNNATV